MAPPYALTQAPQGAVLADRRSRGQALPLRADARPLKGAVLADRQSRIRGTLDLVNAMLEG